MIYLLIYLYQRMYAYSPALTHASVGLVVACSLARFSNPVNFYLRQLLFILLVAICSAIGVCSAVILVPLQKRTMLNWVVARSFNWGSRLVLGVRTKVRGTEHLPSTPCIFVSNHQSALDLISLGAIFPKNGVITAKAALKYYPPLGSFMMLANNIFINRSNRQGAVQTFKAAVDQIHQKKVSVYIFPEGTRGRLGDGQLLPFKKGAFHMAIQAGIPIVPVVFSNYSSFYNPKHHYFTGGTVQIQVLPPITTEGLTTEDVDQLSTSTRDQMTHALVKLLEEQKKNI